MATNHLHSLADENPDLRKQIRCMTSVFHIFNRHHILPGSSVVSHHPNRVLPDNLSASRNMNHQSLDLRDVVKDSMHREARGLGFSHNVLVELQEPNWYHDEPIQHSRSKSCQFKDGFPSISKSYPRFSYDGSETDCLSMKEPPRLSLDSKSIPSPRSRNPKSDKGMITKPPSVVAKLMGLETYPDSTSTKISKPCWKNPDLKPISRVSIEAAPWKQWEAKSSSVYNEMDKRLKNLEFAESGKDLRALKRILEAMQAVEARKTERISDHDHHNPPHIVIMKPAKIVKKGKDPIKDSCKPKKKSNVYSPESRSANRRRQPSNHDEKRKLSERNGGGDVNASECFGESNSRLKKEKSTLVVKVRESTTPENPSPVSVLDDSVYISNSPSPVKHTPNTQKDYAKQNLAETFDKDEYEARNDTLSTTIINRKKLQKVENLVQKLKRLNSSHNEAHTDYIASLCENTNPNNIYISEILLASGILLRDLESFQLHSSGHPINPNLFLVLERTKFRNQEKQKSHRKLIFDSVNEILLGKYNSGYWKVETPRELLRELCLEIEQKKGEDDLESILREDVLKRSGNWKGFDGESPVVAMEVECLIFTDLVDELVVMMVKRGRSWK